MTRRRSRQRRTGPVPLPPEIDALFHDFATETMRAVARGEGAGKVAMALAGFVDFSARARAPWSDSIAQALSACDALIDERAGQSELDRALFDLGRAGLALITEALARDPVAAARSALRSDDLHRAVLLFLRACEREARRENWSYIDLLAERLTQQWEIRPSPPAPDAP